MAGLWVLGAPSSGQAQFEAALAFGTRLDAGSAQRGTLRLPTGEVQPIVLRQRLRVPWLIGGIRLSHVVYQTLSLEVGYTAALVNVSVHPPDNEDTMLVPNNDGVVHTFALRPKVQLGRFGAASAAHVFAGPVLVWRTGEGFAPYSGTLQGGGSVGLGATLRIRRLLFRADVEDVVYPLALTEPGVLDTRRTVRHDLLLTVGVALLYGMEPLVAP